RLLRRPLFAHPVRSAVHLEDEPVRRRPVGAAVPDRLPDRVARILRRVDARVRDAVAVIARTDDAHVVALLERVPVEALLVRRVRELARAARVFVRPAARLENLADALVAVVLDLPRGAHARIGAR